MPDTPPTVEDRLAQIRERRIKAGRGGWYATAAPGWGSEAQVWGDDRDPIAEVHTSFTPHPDAGDEVCADAGDIAMFIAASHANVGALLDAVEAALSTGLTLNTKNAAGADEPKRAAMCEGAALHMTQVRQAINEALTGRTEGGGDG